MRSSVRARLAPPNSANPPRPSGPAYLWPIRPKEPSAQAFAFCPSEGSHQFVQLKPKKLELKNICPTGCALAFIPFVSCVVLAKNSSVSEQLGLPASVHCVSRLNQYVVPGVTMTGEVRLTAVSNSSQSQRPSS